MTDDPNEQIILTSEVIQTMTNEALYLGFIQALCWATNSNNPTRVNEPNELWDGVDYVKFDRTKFLTIFANHDAECPIMLLKLIDDPKHGPTWEILCTESDPGLDYERIEAEGYKFSQEWADLG
jgi:hypothetical protein